MVVAFDGEAAHAFDQMTSKIDPGNTLGAWVIGIETNKRVLRRNGRKRCFAPTLRWRVSALSFRALT